VIFLFGSFSFVEACGYVDNFFSRTAVWESKGQGWRSFVLWDILKPAHETFPIPWPLFRLKDRTLSWAAPRISKLGIGGQFFIFARIVSNTKGE
jgi:hypothetical protein